MPLPVFLGVDVGSVSVSSVLLDSAGKIESAAYRFHHGKTREALRSIVETLGPQLLSGIAFTTASPPLIGGARVVDSQVAMIAACRHFYPAARSLLFVGGERFGIIHLDDAGNYRGARTNTSCAAGTGSFLEQQARRLGFSGIEELDRRATASTTPPPKISTRCAVFARTDLVHAQQAGYSLEEISDGLCRGLAQNIADTLLGGQKPLGPLVFAGGVALNQAVRRHLEEILGMETLVHERAPVFAAVGAALRAAADRRDAEPSILDPAMLSDAGDSAKEYFFPALLPEEPDDSATKEERFEVSSGRFSATHPVEVDVYRSEKGAALSVWMGIDVGSTSTKAMLIDADREPVVGFYTRTLGSPLTAFQAICEGITAWQERTGVTLAFTGVGTTGAGRKFVGAVIHADLALDEITAHARAACSLDPEIDTIIEIGGQDAKFTTMRNGMVTFSHMNTVCAAGTGSFLEEQADRLGVGLSEYEQRVRGARAPLSSDRCAVFMERDINNFLAKGYSIEEILAAALYSVRENYLSKVARGAAIGRKIAFQGATARNEALVQAFRDGLGKPILVSRYCHLAGALGVALQLADTGATASGFVGLAELRGDIPVRSETCALCSNHCRLRIASVAGKEVAYGFLCGRDYDEAHFVNRDKSGFDLARERRRAFATACASPAPPATKGPLVGLPAALSLYGHLPLWARFFALLGIRTVSSEGYAGIDLGRETQGAEFCAPIASLHGHARYLADKADWLFLPTYLEEAWPGAGNSARVHCYYTQWSSALVAGSLGGDIRGRCLTPQASWTRWRERTKNELHAELRRAGLSHLTRAAVAAAFEQASGEYEAGIRLLQGRFVEETAHSEEPSVVLLGRPYNVLSPEMSKGIPAIFGTLGVKTFYQDMVPINPERVREIAPLLDMVHWLHAARILEATATIADFPKLYPVFITSFKCTPDSYALEYFKRILDEKGKPYLILQLDDHDSTLGYETRIEAGVASFRNHLVRTRAPRASGGQHWQSAPATRRVVPRVVTKADGRTVLFPAWDPLVNPLLVANLRRSGLDARLLEEDGFVIRKAMRQNTGQCLPLTIIAQEAVDYIRKHDLDPSRTALWLPRSNLSCNLGMFTPFLKSLMEAEGQGMERAEVYAGDMFYLDLSPRITVNAYKAYLAGGLLRRVGCRMRPYEIEPGATDAAIAKAMGVLIPAFEGKARQDDAMRRAASLFDAVRISEERRPRVAVFGDLYVRDNEVMNQDLFRAIEQAGGEAITTPYTEYIRIIAESCFRKMTHAGLQLTSLLYRTVWVVADSIGSGYRRHFERFLDPEQPVDDEDNERFLEKFGVRAEHAGESFENLMKIRHLSRVHPELALFVQASPALCCPSMVTEAMARDIERLTGVPVVSITYDGTGRYQNELIVPYLAGRAPARALHTADSAPPYAADPAPLT